LRLLWGLLRRQRLDGLATRLGRLRLRPLLTGRRTIPQGVLVKRRWLALLNLDQSAVNERVPIGA
jgi:hypothetical protein